MIEEEKYILAKHVNISLEDASNMSVYQRRLHLGFLKKDVERQKEEMDKQKQGGQTNFKKRK